ncbi:MAG: pseudouridine synthase [Pseudomonadota bacterium]|nr:pseudouridine synthase [Pseudomonadota bacterium]
MTPQRSSKPPPRDGVAASTLHLPAGQWRTVFDCLVSHFDEIGEDTWVGRFQRGCVLDGQGQPLSMDAAYREGLRVHYYREVPAEPSIPFQASIVHQDDHLLIADKPHFLPVAPVGGYVRETLLTRLQQLVGNDDLVPLHRLDRGTAGLVMFSMNRGSRAAYQALFREHRIQKEYEATARALPDAAFPLIRCTRIERGEPFNISREAPGRPNTHTRIELKSAAAQWWRYALFPVTGKKHQLRVHMAALGAPIRNDDLYPVILNRHPYDFDRPLQLLARALSFTDPVTGEPRVFESTLRLQ